MNLTILKEQTRLLVKALESDWAALSEEIEKDILPGRPVPPECNAELHTDYAGAAVRWVSLTLKKVQLTAVRLA
ncbi:hypothetical protein LWI29_004367 [Acer saccharum]|uniref:Uncharacterized protein n=1 Tax=Acer saccharum TaxID=4024 RepID=A0AA39SMR1_ACESA|nr:hypothetical protein LWI29_004367 [Acer saccharum]